MLGKSNSAGHTTTLHNRGTGAALALKTKQHSVPPLTVGNNKTLVPHLNANYLDGLSATKLQRRIASTCAVGAVASVSSTGAVVCRSFAGIPTTFGAGTNAYKVPAGVHKVEVRLWGGGGSGGDGDGYASGGGGGQGGMVDALVDVSPGDVLSFDVGAGGVLTYAGYAASGVQGADSTVGYAAGGTGTPAQILIAHGGSGGTSSFNGCDTETADGGTATAAQPALGLVEAEGASGGAGSCGSGAGIAGGAADSAGGGGQGGDFAPQSSDPNGHGRPGADGLAMVTPESS